MEKDKGLFSFRKHPVGDFLDEKEGRKRKGGRLRQSMGFLMAAALIFNTLPASGLAVSASGREAGLCEHHTEHTPDCGYREAQPCTHEHTEECYKTVTECVHTHTDGCYPETGETEESTGEGNATPSDAGNREPSLCTHVCSEESGCVTKVLDCHHEHDESCGYQEAQDCGYVCEICNGTEPEDTGENTEDTGTDTAKCICKALCTEDSFNGDCPVCGADGASLLDCKGKVSEENTGEQEDTGICKHHQEHDADCGYIPKSEDGEGNPCTYECRICPVEDLIADLPDKVTEDNGSEVRAQLDEILALYRELDEDEQGQIDLSRIYALQGALDAANAPVQAAEEITIYNSTEKILSEETGGCLGHTFTGTAQRTTIYVESGTHNVTFSSLNILSANVGIAPGATMNLTIEGANTIQASSNLAGIYVPAGATLIINGPGSLDVSGDGNAGIGGADNVPGENGSEGDPNCGTVVINGGTITATGGSRCAGIGGGIDAGDYNPGNGGNVTINGGTVTATGGSDGSYGGAGIGGAGGVDDKYGELVSGSGGTLTINGGKVTLKAGQYNPQYPAYGFGQGSGSAPGGTCELTLADASYLTVDSLDPNGKYTINGDPTPDMIVVPEDLVYNGKAQELDGKIYIDDTKTGTGTYFGQTFTVKASADGWVLQELGEVNEAKEYTATFKKGEKEISKTFTVAQSGTDLADGKVLTYNGDTPATTFTAGDTITVKATPTATGAAPKKAAARLQGGPGTGQMALYVGDALVSSEAADADADGSYTMTVSASDVLTLGGVEPNGDPITLTAKFVGNDNMADGAGMVGVNISAVAKVEKDKVLIGYVGESGLDAAFANSGYAGATFTLLADVERTTALTIKVNCILDLNGKTIRSTGATLAGTALGISSGATVTIRSAGTVLSEHGYGLSVGGTATLEGGTFISSGEDCSGIYVQGKLIVTSEAVVIENTGGGTGLGVNSGIGATAQLSAGTYGGGTAAIEIYQGTGTLAGLLNQEGASRVAYYKDNATLVTEGLNGQTLPSGSYTVRVCTHAYQYTHTTGATTHSQTCPACGDAKAAETCSYDAATGRCACGSTLAVTLPADLALTYDGTAKTPAVTVTVDGTELVAEKYQINYDNNINAGNTAKVTVTAANGSFSGSASITFSIGKASLTIKANNQTITYGGSITTGTDQVTATGLASGDTLESVTLMPSSDQVAVADKTITPSGAKIQNSSGAEVTGNYEITYVPGNLTINRAQGTLTVPAGPVTKTFGDGQFLLGCSTNGDGKISYASSDENVASVSADGNVLIKGAGEATITVSLAEGTNYTGAAGQTVRITVEKASVPVPEKQAKQYIYTKGSDGKTDEFDAAEMFPADKGKTEYGYSISGDAGILSGVAVDKNGKLSYQVAAGAAGSTASITVTAEMANYKNATVTLEIKLVEKIKVKITAEPENAVYDGTAHTGYAGKITCDYPVDGYAFAYTGRGGTAYGSGEPPVNAGSYAVEIRVSDESGDYEGSVSLDFTVEKASIRIRADDKTAEKGGQLPKFTYSVYGLAAKDSLAAAPELKCSADMNTAGSYPITAGGAKVPDNGNYKEEIAYENGTLAVVDQTVRVTGVSLDKTAMRLDVGSTGQLTASVFPENATNKSLSWSSGNTAVASVDGSGKVSAAGAGTAVITVTTADGGHTASCTVTVQKAAGGSPGSSGGSGNGSGGSGGSSGSSGSPGSSPGSSGASSGSSGSSGTKQPALKDSSGREGWDVIRAEAEKTALAPEGGTVAVDMNGAVSVPGSIFAAVKGKDVTVSFDMGGGITWSVNGKDITAEPHGDTDFSVKADAGTIPKELAAEKAGGLAHLEFSLAHEGTFGFTATLSIQIKSSGGGIAIGSGPADAYTGMYANLFYYSPQSRILEFICAGKIGEDGTAHLPFAHASDYTLIVSAQPMGGTGTPENPEGPKQPDGPESPQQPGENTPAQVKSVKLSRTVYTYSGKAKKPSVTAVDTDGRKIPEKYYTVTYKNNKKVGKATAAVRFKGAYSGTVKKTFTIRPAGTSIKKRSASSGGFTVKWAKKTAQTDGYQIQYSGNAGYKGNSTGSVFVKKASTVKKSVQGLKAGKKYYVRIRTYKTVKTGGKSIKIYSAWSSSSSIRTLPASAGKRKPSVFPGQDQAFLMVEKQDGKKKAA